MIKNSSAKDKISSMGRLSLKVRKMILESLYVLRILETKAEASVILPNPKNLIIRILRGGKNSRGMDKYLL